MDKPSSIRVIKFETKYVQRGGDLIPVDMVEYCAVGEASRSTTRAPVKEILGVRPLTGPDDTAGIIAHERARVIGRAYDGWKEGNDIPDDGTPLAAWSGVTPHQAEVFKAAGIRTVEEIAGMTDTVRGRINLPGLVTLQQQAVLFVDNRHDSKLAAQLAEREAEIALMREEQEEMKRILLDMQGERDRPRRGRPPKVRDEAPEGEDSEAA